VGLNAVCFAGGGEKHAWCEAVLLEDGSRQRDIWDATRFAQIQNSKCKIQNYFEWFCFVFIIIAAMILIISSFSAISGKSLFSSTIFVAVKRRNQYLVSFASFKAISNLLVKSALLCAD
jgi:hypothetical protein